MAHHNHAEGIACRCDPALTAGHHPEPGEYDEEDGITTGESRISLQPPRERQEGTP